MSPERNQPVPHQLVIREEISTRAIEALMANYRDSQQAVLDLIDNAVDNRIEGKPSVVRVRVSKDEITITNLGGKGLGLEGLTNYFKWGHSDKTDADIGQFGVGGKAAMGFLGRGMEIICSSDGSYEECHVEDSSWESRLEGELKEFMPERRRTESEAGYFRVRVTGLKRVVNSQALAAKIGDIYRPLLLDRSVSVLVNGKPVEPIDIRYVEADPELSAKKYKLGTRFGDNIEAEFGILQPNQRVKPGIRCYYRGRLIESEQFFGHPGPAQLAGASRLAGEVHLDNVPVTPNKSSFNHSSLEWEQASRAIYNALGPWVEKAEKLRPETSAQVEKYEHDIAKNAKRVVEHVLSESGIITRALLPGAAQGRMPVSEEGSPRPRPKGTHKSPEKIEGATAPKLPSRGEVKRWGATHQVDVVSMGSDQIRSVTIDEEKTKRKILMINSDFPFYRASKKLGPEAQELYMAETIAMEICRLVAKDRSVEDYVEMVNQIMGECGRIIGNKILRRTPRK